MKKQKQTRKELVYWYWTLKPWVLLLVSVCLIIFTFIPQQIKDQKDLTQCQDDLKNIKSQNGFEIRYSCSYSWMNQTLTNNYFDYESYQRALESIKSYENCEVLP